MSKQINPLHNMGLGNECTGCSHDSHFRLPDVLKGTIKQVRTDDFLTFGEPKTHICDAEAIAEWMEGLSRHRACPAERRYWYEGVAADIRNGAYKKTLT